MTIANHGRDHPTTQAQRRYCCFRIPSPCTVRCSWWSKIRTRGTGAFNKIREWSEPRWKTFVRRFKRNHRSGSTARTFRYDPLSYALNFDDGLSHEDGYYASWNFSSRYAMAKAGGGGGVGSTFV